MPLCRYRVVIAVSHITQFDCVASLAAAYQVAEKDVAMMVKNQNWLLFAWHVFSLF
jgi:hypothetical protein